MTRKKIVCPKCTQLVGEASHTNAAGDDVFACFVAHTDGAYEARYMTQREFTAWKAIRQERDGVTP